VTIQSLTDILIGLVLVGWIVYRQLTWQIVSISRMWRMPLLLGLVGVVMLAQTNGAHVITAVDVAVLVIELAISVGIGLVMGRIAVFRTRTIRPGDQGDPLTGRLGDRRRDERADRRDRRRGYRYGYSADERYGAGDRARDGDRGGDSRIERTLNPDGTKTVLESRTGWLGLVLWIVLILVRIGCDVIASQLGSTLATSIGVILVMVAANRAVRTAVFAARVQNRLAVTA